MRRFTQLFLALDQTTSTNEKIAAIEHYLSDVLDGGSADADSAAWAIHFLNGNRLKRLIKRAELWEWLRDLTGYPDWLVQETYQSVGDSAETIALLLPEPDATDIDERPLAHWVTQRLEPLPTLEPEARAAQVKGWWQQLSHDERFVLNKLITGGFRVGVARKLVVRALAQYSGLESAVIAHRLMGQWVPSAESLRALFDPDSSAIASSTPYPFYLASPLENAPTELGEIDEWQAEWKWDGIRAQVIRRDQQTFIWSRGEEQLNGRFPEIEAACAQLPDGSVLDGEILAWENQRPLPFATLQRRIGRLRPGTKLLKEAPVILRVYDLLEWQGDDLRQQPLVARLATLQDAAICRPDTAIQRSEPVAANTWEALAEQRQRSRDLGVEGFMLKRLGSNYGVGRQRGDWWKWKIDPLTIDAVLLYAQPGSGRRSNLLTDYTFAVWQEDELVPVCKAYSGLSNDEIATLDKWIRRNTKERFGPVRSLQPEHVFEIAFEGIQHSRRHKSGVALRFPRIKRWRQDLTLKDAEQLQQVIDLIPQTASSASAKP